MDKDDFWVQKEAEIGETVDVKFYCNYLSGDWPVKGPLTGVLFFSKSTLFHLLSDQAMCLYFIKKPVKYGRFSVLGCTFQGQKHACKDFGVL